MTIIKLAFGHKCRVGKDYVIEYIKSRYECEYSNVYELRFAFALYKCVEMMQNIMNVPAKKNPYLLQTVGEALKHEYGKDIFVKNVLESTNSLEEFGRDGRFRDNSFKHIICVADLRFKTEFAALKENGYICVKINRPNAPTDRDPNHISEIDLNDATFDYVIDNTGTLEDFNNNIDKFITEVIEPHPTR